MTSTWCMTKTFTNSSSLRVSATLYLTTEHTQDKFRTIQIAATVRIMNAATLSFFYMNWESLCFHRHSLENKTTQVQILHLEIDQITSLSLFVLNKFYSPSLDLNREKLVSGITANRTSI